MIKYPDWYRAIYDNAAIYILGPVKSSPMGDFWGNTTGSNRNGFVISDKYFVRMSSLEKALKCPR